MSSNPGWTELVLMAPHWVALFFAFAFGACAGSFINVVAWRLPMGMSVISPPSRCPVCGHRLSWRENLPVLGYLLLRGRCKACGIRIPPQYLMVELVMGVVFMAVYALLFMPVQGSFWYGVGEGWWRGQGLGHALPGLLVVLVAVSSLAAMTLADARTFHIPLQVPTCCTLVAFGGWLVQAWVATPTAHPWPLPVPTWSVLLAGLGGVLGVLVSWMLLRVGWLQPSFADYEEYVKEGETFADYPHARREMLRELAFLAPPAALALLGYVLSGTLVPEGGVAEAPLWLQALGASAVGFLAGGAIIWVVRIVATLVLGVEAMGLGDVHLMACVGAALGWVTVLVGFVVAPFIGLTWWLANLVRHAPMRQPFGPSLAIGCVMAYFLSPVLTWVFQRVRVLMEQGADLARQRPGMVLAMGGVLGLVGLVGAFFAGRSAARAGGWAALSILAMVGGVIAWIFGSPGGLLPTLAVGGGLVVLAGSSAKLAGVTPEEEAGPRTTLRRIMLLLLLVVLVMGVFLALVRPPEKPLFDPRGTGQTESWDVQ